MSPHLSASPPDVLVIGAGVNGLMTARELSAAGHRVLLLERGEVGREASWAGGGIVSPLYPWRYSAPVTALARPAQQAYPALARELEEETGIDPEFFPCGMLMLDAADARDALVWGTMQEQVIEPWSEPCLRQPGLAAHWQQGLWMPAVANIRNPRLLKALRASVLKRGVDIREASAVTGWEQSGGHVSAVLTESGERFSAASFVLCGGAWTSALLAQARSGQGIPLRPVRGQMLMYRLAAGALPCIVLAEGRYVIPRRDGHVLCGSTQEEAGFDKSTTADAFASLAASAARLWPALAAEKPVAHWAGLRPAAPNGIPFIGPVPEFDNLWVNAGQFRNGLVLAPASARLLTDQMLQRPPLVDPRPYQMLPAGT